MFVWVEKLLSRAMFPSFTLISLQAFRQKMRTAIRLCCLCMVSGDLVAELVIVAAFGSRGCEFDARSLLRFQLSGEA